MNTVHFFVSVFHGFLHCCHGSQVSNFLWPFKLSSPKGGFINKRFKLSQSVFFTKQPGSKKQCKKDLAKATVSVKLVVVIGATVRQV